MATKTPQPCKTVQDACEAICAQAGWELLGNDRGNFAVRKGSWVIDAHMGGVGLRFGVITGDVPSLESELGGRFPWLEVDSVALWTTVGWKVGLEMVGWETTFEGRRARRAAGTPDFSELETAERLAIWLVRFDPKVAAEAMRAVRRGATEQAESKLTAAQEAEGDLHEALEAVGAVEEAHDSEAAQGEVRMAVDQCMVNVCEHDAQTGPELDRMVQRVADSDATEDDVHRVLNSWDGETHSWDLAKDIRDLLQGPMGCAGDYELPWLKLREES